MPRTTNADQVLSEARERLAAAEQVEIDAAAELRLASTIVGVHRANLAAAEKLLAPKPRNKVDPKPERPQTAKPKKEPEDQQEEKEVLCGACGNVEGYQDHFQPSPNYHKFDRPKTEKKAKQKSAAAEKETAIAAGAGELKT
jgi:hypothetical protein